MTISPNGKKRYNSTVKHLQANKERAEKMTLRQFRYIKLLDQRWKQKCLLKEQPYPKHYAENPNGFEKTEAGGAILNFSYTELSNGNES